MIAWMIHNSHHYITTLTFTTVRCIYLINETTSVQFKYCVQRLTWLCYHLLFFRSSWIPFEIWYMNYPCTRRLKIRKLIFSLNHIITITMLIMRWEGKLFSVNLSKILHALCPSSILPVRLHVERIALLKKYFTLLQ